MQIHEIQDTELVAGILLHLNRAFLSGCTQSCAITSLLLSHLAKNTTTNVALQTACENLRETLEEWQQMDEQERLNTTPWVLK